MVVGGAGPAREDDLVEVVVIRTVNLDRPDICKVVMTRDFEDDLVTVVFEELHEAQLVSVFIPVREGFLPPASCLIDVHHGEELFVWACIFELLLEPIELISHLLRVTLIVLVIEGQGFETKQGQLAWNQISTVPATLL